MVEFHIIAMFDYRQDPVVISDMNPKLEKRVQMSVGKCWMDKGEIQKIIAIAYPTFDCAKMVVDVDVGLELERVEQWKKSESEMVVQSSEVCKACIAFEMVDKAAGRIVVCATEVFGIDKVVELNNSEQFS